MNKYILGVDPLPPHLQKKVMVYQTMSGGCGFELWGSFRSYEGHVGDLLVVEGKKMFIRRAEYELTLNHLEPTLNLEKP